MPGGAAAQQPPLPLPPLTTPLISVDACLNQSFHISPIYMYIDHYFIRSKNLENTSIRNVICRFRKASQLINSFQFSCINHHLKKAFNLTTCLRYGQLQNLCILLLKFIYSFHCEYIHIVHTNRNVYLSPENRSYVYVVQYFTARCLDLKLNLTIF